MNTKNPASASSDFLYKFFFLRMVCKDNIWNAVPDQIYEEWRYYVGAEGTR